MFAHRWGDQNMNKNVLVSPTFPSEVANEDFYCIEMDNYKSQPINVRHPQTCLDNTVYVDERLDCFEVFVEFLLLLRFTRCWHWHLLLGKEVRMHEQGGNGFQVHAEGGAVK